MGRPGGFFLAEDGKCRDGKEGVRAGAGHSSEACSRSCFRSGRLFWGESRFRDGDPCSLIRRGEAREAGDLESVLGGRWKACHGRTGLFRHRMAGTSGGRFCRACLTEGGKKDYGRVQERGGGFLECVAVAFAFAPFALVAAVPVPGMPRPAFLGQSVLQSFAGPACSETRRGRTGGDEQ